MVSGGNGGWRWEGVGMMVKRQHKAVVMETLPLLYQRQNSGWVWYYATDLWSGWTWRKLSSVHTVHYPLQLLMNLHLSQNKSLTRNFWSITYRQMETEQNELMNKWTPLILFTTSCVARTPQSLSWIETFNSTQVIFSLS